MVTSRGDGNEDTSLIPVDVGSASKPSNLSDAQAEEMASRESVAVGGLIKADGSEAMTLADQIANVGVQDQKAISRSTELLQEKMGNVFYSERKSRATDELTKNIGELQGALTKINPRDIEREAKFRFLRTIPLFGNWIVRVLKEAANRRMTLQDFIDHLEESLSSGEAILRQDNAQLKVMYSELEDKQGVIEANAYYAELLMDSLSEALGTELDAKKKGELQKVLFRVSTRAQDLRAMENIYEQFFVSIEMTRDNNDVLIATVRRMLTSGMQVIYVGFAIHSALARQAHVVEAAKATRDFVGNMLVSNASMVDNHIKEIGDLYREPIVAMNKMQEAVDILSRAIDNYNRMQTDGIENAKENVARIRDLTSDLRAKKDVLPDAEIESLEAGEVLQIPSAE